MESTTMERSIVRNRDKSKQAGVIAAALERSLAASFWPLDAPGMPLPGIDFHTASIALGDETSLIEGRIKKEEKLVVVGDELQNLHNQALRKPGFSIKVEGKAKKRKDVYFVPGHIWGSQVVDGPHPSDVMLVGKWPGRDELRHGRNMTGASGKFMGDALGNVQSMGKRFDIADWYVTNIVKFMPPDGIERIKKDWIKDCLPLLRAELRIVRPKYILCLGADASKTVLGDWAGVNKMEGRVAELEYDCRLRPEDPELIHTACVMTILHPAQVLRVPEETRRFERSLWRWGQLTQGFRFDKEEEGVQHRVVDNLEDLKAACYEADQNCRQKVIAVDAEWHGEHPCNAGSYIRTIQFSWADKRAVCVVLTAAGGADAFAEGKEVAIECLNEFFADKRVVGHFFNADLEWLVDCGLDLREQFGVPRFDEEFVDCTEEEQKDLKKYGYGPGDDIPAWLLSRWRGGADTGLMVHAIEETAQFKLETLALRYTSAPRYDADLRDWVEEYCKQQGHSAAHLEGYGECPDHVLHPYANYDADVTYRLYWAFHDLLDGDYDGNCCREPFWLSMRAAPAVLEMHQTGIMVSKRRVDHLTEVFLWGKERQEKQIRKWARWPEFNIRSVFQVREFLYGEKYNGKVIVSEEGNQIVRIRPEGARSLFVDPILDTSKRPVQWDKIRANGDEHLHTPGTNKMILSILAQENENYSSQINWLRDYRFVDQVLKSILRTPVEDEESGGWLTGEDGFFEYDAGLPACICDDGRVRTHIYQTKETGRWSSARPPLQNISKQRDSDYRRILGEIHYQQKLRTVLHASPGHLLLEADYTGAELYGMALMAGDANMIADYESGKDIHSAVGVLAFGLDCPPTKAGLKSIPNPRNPGDPDGCTFMRVIAKSVIFGIAYGRGAKAIALAAKELGVRITSNQAQDVINTIFEMYPKLVDFFNECKERAVEFGWMCNCFGRFRRFPKVEDRMQQGEFERQAMNYPIQSMIADAMSRAIDHVYTYRYDVGEPHMYKMLLQIHDAILLEVPYEHLERVVDEVIPVCMVDSVPIYPAKLDGVPTGAGPYKLAVDIEVQKYWGEDLTVQRCQKLGVSERFAS